MQLTTMQVGKVPCSPTRPIVSGTIAFLLLPSYSTATLLRGAASPVSLARSYCIVKASLARPAKVRPAHTHSGALVGDDDGCVCAKKQRLSGYNFGSAAGVQLTRNSLNSSWTTNNSSANTRKLSIEQRGQAPVALRPVCMHATRVCVLRLSLRLAE